MVELKIAPSTINDYISQFPQETQAILQKIKHLIKEDVPDAVETISYGIPTFKLNGKNLVHFAGYNHHIGFYPTPSGIVEFEAQLAPYQKGKGTLQFPLDQPIPYALITKVVRFRVKAVMSEKK